MDFGFEGLDSEQFNVELEEVRVVKFKKFDRMLGVGEGGSIQSTPLIIDGIVYFGSCDNFFYALDSKTGEVVWKYKTGGIIMSSPCCDGDRIFATSYDCFIYCLDIKTGNLLWRFRTGGKIFSSPYCKDGVVYFGSTDRNVYAVRADNGKEVWRFPTGDEINAAPLAAEDKIYVGSYDGNVYVLDAGTGKELWRFKTGEELFWHYPPLLKDGILYFASFDNFLYALDTRTRKVKWKFRTGKFGNAGMPVIHGDRIYHGERGGTFYCLTMDGEEKWRFVAGETISQRPLIHNGRIYLGTEDFNMYCLSLDGKELWRFRTGGYVYSSPVFHGNMIYFGSWDCHLYALDTETGKEAWSFITNTPKQSYEPPPHPNFRFEIKREMHIEEPISGDKYKSARKEKTVSLSDYHVAFEYAMTSDYKQKSEYDAQFVMPECDGFVPFIGELFLNSDHNLFSWD
jgi:outer membrane protein assembly factor BamB